MSHLLKATVSDFKLIFREGSLRVFLVLPFLIFAVINGFLPYLVDRYPVVMDYVIHVLMVVTTETPVMFIFIYSTVFLDEKETHVAKVYGVLPLHQMGFVLFRLLLPMLIATGFTWMVLMLQPFFEFPLFPSLIIALLASLHIPLYAMTASLLSKNRMSGLVWLKLLNLLIIIPIVAFFISPTFKSLFGIIPSYWTFLSLEQLNLGEPIVWPLSIGFIYSLILILIVARLFVKRHFE